MPSEDVFTGQSWTVDVAGIEIALPIVAVAPDLAISLMMIIDLGVAFGAHAGAQLAARLAPLRPEIVVGAATLGIPVAIEVTRALALDRYVILQKSPKMHLRDALTQAITSITSAGSQRLLLDRRDIPTLRGRRVVLVDDVAATGSSLRGALALLREAGANVVGIGVVLTEAFQWRATLGPDAELVQSLAHIPQFAHAPGSQEWRPIPATL